MLIVIRFTVLLYLITIMLSGLLACKQSVTNSNWLCSGKDSFLTGIIVTYERKIVANCCTTKSTSESFNYYQARSKSNSEITVYHSKGKARREELEYIQGAFRKVTTIYSDSISPFEIQYFVLNNHNVGQLNTGGFLRVPYEENNDGWPGYHVIEKPERKTIAGYFCKKVELLTYDQKLMEIDSYADSLDPSFSNTLPGFGAYTVVIEPGDPSGRHTKFAPPNPLDLMTNMSEKLHPPLKKQIVYSAKPIYFKKRSSEIISLDTASLDLLVQKFNKMKSHSKMEVAIVDIPSELVSHWGKWDAFRQVVVRLILEKKLGSLEKVRFITSSTEYEQDYNENRPHVKISVIADEK